MVHGSPMIREDVRECGSTARNADEREKFHQKPKRTFQGIHRGPKFPAVWCVGDGAVVPKNYNLRVGQERIVARERIDTVQSRRHNDTRSHSSVNFLFV